MRGGEPRTPSFDPSCPADAKYAIIGTALGVVISAGFLALKICMIRKHLFDHDSSDLRSTNARANGKDVVPLSLGAVPDEDMFPAAT